MTIHKKMFDGKEKKERTYHRVYVEFERMVNEHGGPNIVEFRDTDEKWMPPWGT